MAESLYNKYRPQVFGDVVGQDHVERTLRNAIAQGKASHAYLLTGPRGTGKTTTARLLAKALLCKDAPTADPCGQCEDCQMIANGEHPDVYELDAASRTGVDNVREEIISRVQFAPTRGKSKVYIIDEVHMLTTAAFNALLKTLEEPPSHVVFILCTTDPQKVPETIHSRCQRFDFHRISADEMTARLGAVCVSEGVEFEGEALDIIAGRAEGGMRNALTALEQAIAFGEGKVTRAVAESMFGSLSSDDMSRIMELVGTRNVAGCFTWVQDYASAGSDFAQFARDMAQHTRNLYVLCLSGGATSEVDLDVTEDGRQELVRELQWFGPDRLARMMAVLGDVIAELKTSTNARLSFEIALTRLVRPDSDLTLAALAERIEALESGYSAAAHVPAVAVAPVATAVQPQQAQPQPQPQQAQAQQLVAQPQQVAQPARQQQAQAAAQPQPQRQAVQPAVQQQVAQPAAQQPVQRAAQPVAQQQATQQQAAQPAANGAWAANMGNPAALQRAWQSVLGQVKKLNTAHSTLFIGARVAFDETAQRIIVIFPADNNFAFKAAQGAGVMSTLKAAFVRAMGAEVPFAIMTEGEAAAGGARPAQAQQAQAQAQAQPSQAQQAQAQQAQAQQRTFEPPQKQKRQYQRQQAQPQQQMQQAQQVQQAQPARQAAPSSQDDFDRVPLDAYDGFSFADDGYGSYGAAQGASQSGARGGQQARAQQTRAQQQAAQPQVQGQPQRATQPAKQEQPRFTAEQAMANAQRAQAQMQAQAQASAQGAAASAADAGSDIASDDNWLANLESGFGTEIFMRPMNE